jgi:hypothetical protein
MDAFKALSQTGTVKRLTRDRNLTSWKIAILQRRLISVPRQAQIQNPWLYPGMETKAAPKRAPEGQQQAVIQQAVPQAG